MQPDVDPRTPSSFAEMPLERIMNPHFPLLLPKSNAPDPQNVHLLLPRGGKGEVSGRRLSKIALPQHPLQILQLLGREGLSYQVSTSSPSSKDHAQHTLTSTNQVSCLVFLKSLKTLLTLLPTTPVSLAALPARVANTSGNQAGGGDM